MARKGGPAAIELEGGPQLRRAFRKFDDRLDDLSAIHKEVGEVVAAEARQLVPVRTGRLRRTIKAARSKSAAYVRAGSRIPPYAGPIHFGWHARDIEPQPFLYDALDHRRDEVVARYRDGVGDLVEKFDREAPDL